MKWNASLEPLKRYRLIVAFAMIVAAAMFTSAAKALILAYPCGCLYVGFRTFKKNRGLFVEFAVWCFVLTPFVRRIVDYETNARETIIISAPFLVLLIPLLFVVTRWTRIVNRQSAPFIYALAAVFYGAFIACVHMEFSSAASALATWLTPIAFGLYLLSERDRMADLCNGFERAMLGGTFVAGVYGLIQYFFLPRWDAAWMRSVEMVTIGKPEPTEVRVFSTLNSPQILAAYLMVGILLAYRLRSRWRYPVLTAGVASLALSFARSAWLGLFAGLIFLAFRSSSREKFRTITATAGCALLLITVFSIPEVSDALAVRFSTFEDLRHDESALDRKETYIQVTEMLQRSPAGIGLGVDNGMADAENDSSVVAVLLSLGIPGALIFAVALGICAAMVFSAQATRQLPQLLGLQCSFVGLVVESPLNNVVHGQIGFLLWSLVGLSCGIWIMQRLEISNELKAAVVIES